jgi:hypothetical protein
MPKRYTRQGAVMRIHILNEQWLKGNGSWGRENSEMYSKKETMLAGHVI